jgi:hypothetical protein
MRVSFGRAASLRHQCLCLPFMATTHLLLKDHVVVVVNEFAERIFKAVYALLVEFFP